MKSLLSLLVVCALSTIMVGCAGNRGGCATGRCGHGFGGRLAAGGHGGHAGHGVGGMSGTAGRVAGAHGHDPNPRQFNGDSGPPTGAVAYPYYTTRGPRDFLSANPPSIGY